MSSKNEYNPDDVSPPGATLQELLEAYHLSRAEAADRVGLSLVDLAAFIEGRLPLTEALAEELAKAFAPPKQFWLNRERAYRLNREHKRAEHLGVRDERQKKIGAWCKEAFGDAAATSLPNRGIRMVEEALELAQAVGCDKEMIHKLVDYVFARPVGEIGQELGGLGTTTLALAHAAGLSADAEEAKEVERVLAKPLDYFRARNAKKDEAGFNAVGAARSDEWLVVVLHEIEWIRKNELALRDLGITIDAMGRYPLIDKWAWIVVALERSLETLRWVAGDTSLRSRLVTAFDEGLERTGWTQSALKAARKVLYPG